MGFLHRRGAFDILNWSCSSATAPKRPPASLAFVFPASLVWDLFSRSPTPFFAESRVHFARLVVWCFLKTKTAFLFSSYGMDASRTMHIFGVNSIDAAVKSLDGVVCKRRRPLSALPGLYLVQRSARIANKTDQFPLKKRLRLKKKQFNI